jgi:ribosomal protein S18 acetylase RimI-like enzyme
MAHPHPHAHPHEHSPAPGAPGPLADASVRVARETDAPAVGLVQSVVWREAYAAVLPPEVLEALEPQRFAAAWRRSLAAPPQGVHRLLVACAGDQVVGFAAVGPSQDPDADPLTAELTVLGVHPDARRAGHGSRLLNAAVDTLRDAGAETVHTWALATAEESRAFLARAGFAPDGAWRERAVSADGATAREVRLVAALAGPDAR